MPATPDIAAVLRRPFDEQVAFFRGKLGNLVPTATWRDIMRSAHDRAFMVAGAARADLLADLAAAVDKAISDGESLDAFRARFGEIVRRHGWQGWTGDDRETPDAPGGPGYAWRTRVIYRTNLSTSYAAGRLAQLRAAGYPLWVYRHGGSLDPRPQHLAWDGLTLPPDHPFWRTHYPPSAWGCSCYVVGARSAEGAARLGGKPGYTAPPEGWDVRDAKGRLPGVDEGWDYMPGGTSDVVQAIERKLIHLPGRLADDMARAANIDADDVLDREISNLKEAGRAALDGLLETVLPDDRELVPVISLRGRPLSEAISRGFPEIFRRHLLDSIRKTRQFGGKLSVAPSQETKAARQTTKMRRIAARVAAKLPADWVARMRQVRATVNIANGRGSFSLATYELVTDGSSTAEHEFCHFLQSRLPGLDRMFQRLHRLRTASDPLVEHGSREYARKDNYIHWYFGREYLSSEYSADAHGEAREVLAMTYQAILGEDEMANAMLTEMMHRDRDLLHLAIGALLRYSP